MYTHLHVYMQHPSWASVCCILCVSSPWSPYVYSSLVVIIIIGDSQVEPLEGELWPRERDSHAACCLGYDGDHPHLLIHGGNGNDGEALNDVVI